MPTKITIEGPEHMYRNHYRCKPCGEEWSDEETSMCDDECPECETPYTPFKSEDLGPVVKKVTRPATPGKVTCPPTPMLEKMSACREDSQAIGQFLDWLRSEARIVLATPHKHTDSCYNLGMSPEEFKEHVKEEIKAGRLTRNRGDQFIDYISDQEYECGRWKEPKCSMTKNQLTPAGDSIEKLLAQYFEIDLKQAAAEQDILLEHIRKEQGL